VSGLCRNLGGNWVCVKGVSRSYPQKSSDCKGFGGGSISTPITRRKQEPLRRSDFEVP
jgi:hypothetical protein